MTTIDWVISALDCKPMDGTNTNVVKVVHWRCEGKDGEFSGSVYSACSLPEPEEQFIAFDDLTPETVLSWIWASGVDKQATEAAVEQQIEAAKNPPIVQPPLPW